ncbi:MAG: dehydrogenase [Actinomycetia bacterium]|jgi:NAD(P)-dependent dehydrogenase (short-subunit alcohol dehydrogenase family)|nr:dehydrogenase [Actinomycetes bacterium]
MEVRGRVVVVTGAARGIGAALARRFAAAGARGIVVSDLSLAAVEAVAADIGPAAHPVACDVADEAAVRELVAACDRRFGPVDLFCSNAGVAFAAGLDAPDAAWSSSWAVNVMAHVYAARTVVPSMVERGGGYLLNTCSAAGLLTAAGDAAYTATKHAAVGFAEWLSIMYGDAGVKVSVLCPQGVHTAMMDDGLANGNRAARLVAAAGEMLQPEDVAEAVLDGLAAERFHILPHPEVAGYVRHKGTDPDAWLSAMRHFIAGNP